MQPKGGLSFGQTGNKTNQQKKDELLKEIFAVDNSRQETDQTIDDAESEAQKDLLKDSIKDEEKIGEKLDSLTDLAELVLFRTKSTNPIDLFPDEIIVDLNKISIIFNQFFLSSRVHSVMIKDVSDIFIETGFIWAKLIIVDRGFIENTVEVEFLNKEEALKIRRLVQGLVIAWQQEIDFTKLSKELSSEEIIEKLEKLGKARIGD